MHSFIFTLSGNLAPTTAIRSCAMRVCSLATAASTWSCLPALEGVVGPRTLVIDRLRCTPCAGECPPLEWRRLMEDNLALRAWSDDWDFKVLIAGLKTLKDNATDLLVPTIRRMWHSALVLKLAWLHSEELQIKNIIILCTYYSFLELIFM